MSAGLIAGGYHGPPELTVARAFTSWTLDLPVLAVVALAGLAYLAGARRVSRGGQRWPGGRVAAFGTALAVLVIAAMGFPGVYQGVLFYARAVQTILLLLAAPLFAALGRPLSLLAVTVPGAGRRLDGLLGSRLARVATFPAVTGLVMVLVPFVLYFSPWYGAGLRSGLIRELTYLALFAVGWLFFWPLLRVDPVPKAYSYLVSLWVTGAEVVGDAVLGLAVLASQQLIAGSYYLALARPWGPDPHTDQVIGGGVLWVLGDLIGLPFLAVQLIQMIREDEGEAARIDAELDAGQAAVVTAGAVPQPPAASPGALPAPPPGGPPAALPAAPPAPAGRPWWEDDPRFAGRFRPPGAAGDQLGPQP